MLLKITNKKDCNQKIDRFGWRWYEKVVDNTLTGLLGNISQKIYAKNMYIKCAHLNYSLETYSVIFSYCLVFNSYFQLSYIFLWKVASKCKSNKSNEHM